MKKYIPAAIFGLLLIAVLVFNVPFQTVNQGSKVKVRINEMMASNTLFYADDGESYDWIELYNYGRFPVNVGGFGLSDEAEKPYKWLLPAITVYPGEYLLVWASGKDSYDLRELHGGFSIKSGEEAVILTGADGETISSIAAEQAKDNHSFGYSEVTEDYVWFPYPTPGEENGGLYKTRHNRGATISAPVFSHDQGYYEEAISLGITVQDPQAVIYYTLDGSDPDEHSLVYSGEILLTSDSNENDYANFSGKTFYTNPEDQEAGMPAEPIMKHAVVKAVAYVEGIGTSDVVTGSYFVDEGIFRRFDLPVISIVSDPEGLWDYEKGIYVLGRIYELNNTGDPTGRTPANYNQRGKAWERSSYVTLFETDGSVGFEQDLGLRIYGGWSRAYPHKSFRLIADHEDKDGAIEYELIEGLEGNGTGELLDAYQRFLLRMSGNDWNSTFIRDSLIHTVIAKAPFGNVLDTLAYRPIVVFLNGEYWGLYNIREDNDVAKLGSHYDMDPDEISIIQYHQRIYSEDEGDPDAYKDYEALMDFAETEDLSQEANYQYISNHIDIDNVIAYVAAQTFWANIDWPGNNVKMWRYDEGSVSTDGEGDNEIGLDGRWRYVLYDTDTALHMYEERFNDVSFNSLEFAAALSWPKRSDFPVSTILFRNLMENEVFRMRFINAYASLLNTCYDEAYVLSVVEDMTEAIESEVGAHSNRYSHFEQWQPEVNRMKSFVSRRTDIMWELLQSTYDAGERYEVHIEVNDSAMGTVVIDDFQPLEWAESYSGTYFENIPVTLKAVPSEGYRFVRWDGYDSDEAVITVALTGDVRLKAVFE